MRQKFVYGVRNQTDLEDATYIRGIKPDHGSSQESCAADIRSVLVFKVFLGAFEEPFGVHEWNIWEAEPRVPLGI